MQIESHGSTLLLHGDCVGHVTAQVREALAEHLESHPRATVDLSDVEVVDLTSLRMLAAASRRAHLEGRHLALRGCRPSVRRLLAVSRLNRMVEVERAAVGV
ncbi:STAS domain-containing protein [Nocardioides sp. GY 10127]|uniref:STAS domain-containing protein n=1 Tax=Nocardioides sp. GY 10127 TaxID=2569762 RepID=UPI0010A8DFEC|nr:STAS domain-containing protein [Nocardioides sp. GY 10127]TIC84063.1 STAS domain-containing protein [Nocardioides sp. GY 10127]